MNPTARTPAPPLPWRLLPWLLLPWLFPIACLEQGPRSAGPSGSGEATGIAVLGSDYVSTSLSLLDPATGALSASDVLHSGSAAPGLSVALSGDVGLASSPAPDGVIVLLDRYPSAVLTLVEPADAAVRAQIDLSTGFGANLQDALWVAPDRLWVTRLETNPDPGRQAFDGGDDLLIVTPSTGRLEGRVDLAPLAARDLDPALQARPTRLCRQGPWVWVALAHLGAGFAAAGPGRVAALDPADGALAWLVDLPEALNCTGLLAEGDDALLVACTGLFAAGAEAQLATSALVRVDTATSPPTARVLRRADHAGGVAPYGFDLARARGWLLAVRFGDLAAGRPDRLVAYRADDPHGAEIEVHRAGSAFGLGGVLADDVRGRIYVGDADREHPRVHVLAVDDAGFTPLEALVTHPASGLPPRALAWY